MVQKKRIWIGIIALVIIVVAALVLLGALTGAVGVSGPTKLTLTSTSPIVVNLGGEQYVLLLSKTSPASDTAYVLIGKSPIFVSKTLNVTVLLNNFTKVNAGTGYANMELYLDAVTNSSASVTLTPIQAALGVLPDSGRIMVVSTAGQPTTSIVITVASTTTSTTTTVNETLSAEQRIKNYLTKSEYYPLMANYTAAFANTASCTSGDYNTSYLLTYSVIPSGPSTYQNVTTVAPYALAYNITSIGSNKWAIVYSTVSHTAATTGPALSITMNLTTGLIVNTSFTGIWKDQSYDSLRTALGDVSSISPPSCGLLVA